MKVQPGNAYMPDNYKYLSILEFQSFVLIRINLYLNDRTLSFLRAGVVCCLYA